MRAISGETTVCGIIGWPVEASRSPAMHNAAYADAGLDWVYVAFPVRPGEGARAVEGMRALGVRGLNVTMPHKRDVIAALDALAPEAERAGAVNTIVAEGARLVGTNTDGVGFVRFLERDAGVSPGGLDVLVLGAGGAARAVGIALADAGARVTVTARRSDQATEVASVAGAVTAAWEARSALASDAGLIVNATPIGRDGSDIPVAAASIHRGQVVVDLIYHPEVTALVRAAREQGADGHNGLGMLLHQAALSFEAWTGVPAPLEAMRAALGGQ